MHEIKNVNNVTKDVGMAGQKVCKQGRDDSILSNVRTKDTLRRGLLSFVRRLSLSRRSIVCNPHKYILWTQALLIDKMSGGLFDSIWTCIGPTSRLNLINYLTTTYYLLCESLIGKFSCLHAFMGMRACFSDCGERERTPH